MTTTTSAQVAAAYKAILLNAPPGGDDGAYSISVAAQINAGTLTLGNFESSLIGLPQTMYTTLPVLVTVDAFYGATPSLANLTTAATATSGTSYTSALEMHNLGYSDANVWTIMGSYWGADPNSQFYQFYSGLATGTTADYQTFINEVYQREFGTLPTQTNLGYLMADIPGVQQLLSGGGHTATAIQVMGGLYGYLLYAGQTNNTGAYTTPATNFLAAAATDEATAPGSSAALYGPDLLANPLTNPQGSTTTQDYLTAGQDNVTANNVYGSLTPYNVNGVGPTLQSTDIINGSPGSTNNTLTISDDYAANNDAIPVGTTINNVQNVVLNTQGNAGNNALFDTTPYSGVSSVTVNSSGEFTDNVRVASGTDLTVTHSNVSGNVQTYGGNNVTVTNNGGAGSLTSIGSTSVANANPTGDVTVNAVASNTTVLGGANVTVNQTGIGGAVTIGTAGYSVSPAEPTGTVTVNAPATSTVAAGTPIAVFGGTDTNLTSGGGQITVGTQNGQTVFAPTGNDVIVDNAAIPLAYDYVTGSNSGQAPVAPFFYYQGAPVLETAVSVLGGKDVTITTNAGGVTVGTDASHAYNGSALIPGLLPSGDVTINDSADLSETNSTLLAGAYQRISGSTPVAVNGGANVSVTDAGSAVAVGSVNGTNVIAPTGTVTVNDTAQVAHDGLINPDDHTVNVVGGTDVTVSTNAGDVVVGKADGTAKTEPTGNIQVTESAVDAVTINGGANVAVSGVGGTIAIGSGTAATNATGNVTVTQSGVMTGETGLSNSAVTIDGGSNVSVTETGGNVSAGIYATPITGAVSITDTQSGPNTDQFNVVGGTTVQVDTTATSGTINIGSNLAALDSTGTALKTPTAYATGNVTVVDETVPGSNGAGTKPVYGTGAVDVRTNGATSVSVTGGSSAAITDMETTQATGGANAGKAIGASTLASVALDGVGGAATVTSDALTALSIADSSKSAPTTVQVTETPKHSLTLTLSNDAKGTSVNDGSATAVTIGDSGTAANEIALNVANATALTLNNAAALTLDAGNLTGLKTITGTGAGAVILSNLTTDKNLATVDFSASSGAVTIANLDPTITSFKGGTGNDTVTIDSNSVANPGTGANDTIIGGTGSNTLIANYVALNGDAALGANANIRGFTTLGLGAAAVGLYDAEGFSALTVGQTNGTVFFDKVAAGTSLTVTDNNADGIVYNLQDTKGTNDSLKLNVGVDGSSGTKGITVHPLVLGSDAQSNGIVNLNVNSLGQGGSAQNTVQVIDDNLNANGGNAVQHITVTGDTNLALTYNPGAYSNVSSIDASGSSAKVDVTGVAVSANGVSVKGGAGQLLAAGSSSPTATDSYVTGSGGGKLTLGLGGSWSGTQAAGSYTQGSESVNLSASATVADTLNVGAGVTATNNVPTGGVTGFQSVVGSTADLLNLVSANNAGFQVFNVNNKNVTTSTNVQTFAFADATVQADLTSNPNLGGAVLQNLTFTSANGVLTFGAVGIHTLSEFTQAQLIVAAESIVTAEAAASGTEQVAVFSTGGNSFVVASDQFGNGNTGHVYGASVVELDSVTGITGFGNTGAATVIDTTDVMLVSANHGGSATGASYDDTGYSRDSLNNGARGVTNSFNNLAAAAELDIAFGGDVGKVVVTQLGTAGSDSLTVNLGAGTILDSLTVNGDGTLLLTGNGGKISSLADATNTVTNLSITGSTEIDSISDTALKSVDASKDLGALSLTASQSGLTILGALGGDAITANGAGITIKAGSATGNAMSGGASITANGLSDTITLTNEDGGVLNTISAASASDTITVDSGTNVIGGTIANGAANFALGANDTVNLLSSSGLGAGYVSDTVWVGDNATVNLGTSKTAFGTGNDNATIRVSGDLAQAASSGSYHQTTITGADSLGNNASVTLDLLNNSVGSGLIYEAWAGGNSANAQVNVASATSLGQALDLAANQSLTTDATVYGTGAGEHVSTANGQLQLNAHVALADWFQWGGNTYIVEAINPTGSGAAHAGLAATDAVVQLAGLVNLNNNAHLNVVV